MGKYRLPRTFNWNTLELSLSSSSFDARVIESVQSRLNRSTRPSFLFLYIFFLLVFFPFLCLVRMSGFMNIRIMHVSRGGKCWRNRCWGKLDAISFNDRLGMHSCVGILAEVFCSWILVHFFHEFVMLPYEIFWNFVKTVMATHDYD